MPHHQNTIQKPPASSSSAGPLLALHQVSKAYQTPSGSFIALRDISWIDGISQSALDRLLQNLKKAEK